MVLRGLAASVSLWLIMTVPGFSGYCVSRGGLVFITPEPQCSGIGDSITISIWGSFPDACWSPLVFDSVVTVANQITIHSNASHVDGKLCPGVPVFFFFNVPVGALAPDSYTVLVNAVVVSDSGYLSGAYICDSAFLVAGLGDPNGDAVINSGDIIHLVNYVFKGGTAPCGQSADVTCDGVPSAADIIYLVGYVFKSGPPPPESCGR